jgi:hypothetical protein
MHDARQDKHWKRAGRRLAKASKKNRCDGMCFERAVCCFPVSSRDQRKAMAAEMVLVFFLSHRK